MVTWEFARKIGPAGVPWFPEILKDAEGDWDDADPRRVQKEAEEGGVSGDRAYRHTQECMTSS